MSNLCCICARGGSKGLPGKNIKLFGDKPLVGHAIVLARKSGVFSHLVVSSDSQEILDTAAGFEPDLLVERPADLATDAAGKLPVIKHALELAEAEFGVNYDFLADLDVTAPLRIEEDVVAAYELIRDTGSGSILSGALTHRSPYFNIVELDQDGHVHVSKSPPNPVLSRQAAPKAFDLNGAVYFWNRDRFVDDMRLIYSDTRLYEMPYERSIDINTDVDWAVAEYLRRKSEV